MIKKTDVKEDSKPIETSLVPAASFATMPATTQDAIRVAELIAGSDLAPNGYKGKPGNTYIAMQMGAELGLSPMKSVQSIAVINGKPGLYGDVGKALLLKHGCRIEERDTNEARKLGEGWCKITRPDGSNPTVRTFSIADAQEAGLWKKQGPWTNYPYRMLAWRAFWFAARDAAADFLGGLAGAEEVRDYVDTTLVDPIAEPQRKSAIKAQDEVAEVSQDAQNQGVESDLPQEGTETGQNAGIESQEPEKLKADPLWKPMKSKREGPCANCADEIMVGDDIFWDGKTGKARHAGHFAS